MRLGFLCNSRGSCGAIELPRLKQSRSFDRLGFSHWVKVSIGFGICIRVVCIRASSTQSDDDVREA